MSTWLGLLLIVVANAIAVAVMLLVRRRAPRGGYYNDTQQAGWVYSVAGTSFAVILAFVFLLTFQSFDRARTSASTEAEATAAMYHTTEAFPPAARVALQRQIICYARGVIALEWPAMADGHSSPIVAARVRQLEMTFNRVPVGPSNDRTSAAYSAWYTDEQNRQDGRQGRIDQASPFVPALVWIFLIAGGVIVVAFVWLFADRAETPFAQAALPIGVTTVVVAGLVLVHFFDQPYQDTTGAVRPAAMERALTGMELERPPGRLPCDADGRPV